MMDMFEEGCRMGALVLAGAFVLLPVPAGQARAGGSGEPLRLEVGTTGIHCHTEPCPWRGIRAAAGDVPGGFRDLLWSGQEFPEIRAAAQDRARVIAAWDAYGCLVVEGAFDGDRLHIASILGTCRDGSRGKADQ